MRCWLSCGVVLVLACTSDQPARESVANTDSSAATPIEHAAVTVDSLARPSVAVLRNVRVAAHGDFDRVVFEFDGPLPPYRVSYTDLPVSQCASGQAVDLPGTALLVVRFSPANAHTEAGEASGAPRQLPGSGANIQKLVQVCDFEAVVEWVVALQHARRYKVVELANPSRVAVDIEP